MKGGSALRLQAMPLFSQEANSNFEAAVEGFIGCHQSYRICSVDRWRNVRAGIRVERVVLWNLQLVMISRRLVPNLSLGVILATVQVSRDPPELSSAISKYIHDLQLSMKSEDLAAIPEIIAARNGYRAIGKDPSRYRPSQEALLRRVMQGKGLFKINSVVDVNNLISLRSRNSLGSYDLDQTRARQSSNWAQRGKLQGNRQGDPVGERVRVLVPASIVGNATSHARRRLTAQPYFRNQRLKSTAKGLVVSAAPARRRGRRRLRRDRTRHVVALALRADRGVHLVPLRLLGHHPQSVRRGLACSSGSAMCFDDDSSPPIPHLGRRRLARRPALEAADGNGFAAFRAMPEEPARPASSSCPTSAVSTASTRSSRSASPSAATSRSRSTTSAAPPASAKRDDDWDYRPHVEQPTTGAACRPTSARRRAAARAGLHARSSRSASASAAAARGRRPRRARADGAIGFYGRPAADGFWSTQRPASRRAAPRPPGRRRPASPRGQPRARAGARARRQGIRARRVRGRAAQLLRPQAGGVRGGSDEPGDVYWSSSPVPSRA